MYTLGINAAYHDSAACLVHIGGFDERFPVAWREDSDLAFTLMEQGARLVLAPSAVAIHPIRPRSWGISLSQQRNSMYNVLLYRKHPQLYRERIQAAPPWRYYATVAALLMSMAGLCAGCGGVALAGASIWSILTARFVLERLSGTAHAPSHLMEMLVTSALIPPVCVFWRLLGAIRYRAAFL